MNTRPRARHRNGEVYITSAEGKRLAVIDGEEAMRLAQDLMHAGEKALKRSGKWKPG